MPKAHNIYTSKKQKAASVLTVQVPEAPLYQAVKGWTAAVLAVLHHTGASNIDLLRHGGRTSVKLGAARRLLIWLWLEVAGQGQNELLAEAWLEQCVNIGRRNIRDTLESDPPPKELLASTIFTYSRLQRELGPDDIREAIAAGVLGAPHDRGRIWRKGFGDRLGLELA